MLIYCYLYFYAAEALKLAAKTLAVLTGMFVIHKLISWGLWVLSL